MALGSDTTSLLIICAIDVQHSKPHAVPSAQFVQQTNFSLAASF